MSRLFAPLTSRHRREKQAKQQSLDIGSKDPAPITKSSSFSHTHEVKEKTSITANPPYYHATTNTRPTTPAPITGNTNVPVSHPLTPPQSPGAEQSQGTAPTVESPEPAGVIAPTESAPVAPETSRSSSPAPRPVLEAIQEPLSVVKEAATHEHDLVDLDSNSELDHLSTEELRKQWEDQEIERFLRVFSRQVHEVRSPADLPPVEGKARAGANSDLPVVITENGSEEIGTTSPTTTLNDEDGEEWRFDPDAATVSSSKDLDGSFSPTSIEEMPNPPLVEITKMAASNVVDAVKKSAGDFMTMMTQGQWPGQTPAEYIAMEWLIPYLPPAHRKTYHFSLGTMQATSSRLFLCTYPLYAPLMQRMWLLATWSKPQRSFIYCSLFWVLWWHNMLVPALLTRTLYEVLRRRIFKYPTASELRSRLLAAGRADAVADALTIQLDAHISSGLGMRDVWRVWRIVIKGKKQKASAVAQKGIDLSPVQSEPSSKEEEIEDANFRRFALATMEEIADFNERLVNVARWRRPEATRRYVMVLFFLIVFMVFTPAQILAKGIYAILGIAFWLLPTVVLALPLEHISRIPAPFGDVPTDAEFAMEIIGQRSARGETVLPSSLCNKRKNRRGATIECGSRDASITSTGSATVGQMSGPYIDAGTGEIVNGQEDQGDIGSEEESKKKGGPRRQVTRGMIWVEEGKRMMKGENRALADFDEHPEHLVKTYPAQYRASMGMLTMTPSMILFTPALSSTVEFKIPLQDFRSIKKTGRGMQIKYLVRADQKGNDIGEAMVETHSVGIPTGEIGLTEGSNVTAPVMARPSGEPITKEERFRWIGGRDECFAQLVGFTPGRWVKM